MSEARRALTMIGGGLMLVGCVGLFGHIAWPDFFDQPREAFWTLGVGWLIHFFNKIT